jgi:delta-aminolevulinic acid dehydratase/porphobilinogen synthase
LLFYVEWLGLVLSAKIEIIADESRVADLCVDSLAAHDECGEEAVEVLVVAADWSVEDSVDDASCVSAVGVSVVSAGLVS